MAKDSSQGNQKNIVYNDTVNGDEINDLNEDLLHLLNGLGDNINHGNNKHNYIKQGGIVNKQDEQGNHFGNSNNNSQAQNKNFGGTNELNQNNINDDDDNNNDDDDDNDNDNDNDDDNDNNNQNQARNNNQVEISEDDQSYDDPNI